MRILLIWSALVLAGIAPLVAAAFSPQLAWRHPVYIAAGFAGILALALLLLQPLLAGGMLPGMTAFRSRRIHRWVGAGFVTLVATHVAGLWLTSAPDVIDALLFESPTPFSPWGVVAMWATFAVGLLAAFRNRLPLRPARWRTAHVALVVVVVVGTAGHALLIEGAMETLTKTALCALVLAATLWIITDLRRKGRL